MKRVSLIQAGVRVDLPDVSAKRTVRLKCDVAFYANVLAKLTVSAASKAAESS